jgi:hypothetical protein
MVGTCQRWQDTDSGGEEMKSKKEVIELIRSQERQGNVVFNTIEGLQGMKLEEIIKQPTEGLLYDLNRDKATIMTLMDKDELYGKWINDYAVCLVITKLKEYYDASFVKQDIK